MCFLHIVRDSRSNYLTMGFEHEHEHEHEHEYESTAMQLLTEGRKGMDWQGDIGNRTQVTDYN